MEGIPQVLERIRIDVMPDNTLRVVGINFFGRLMPPDTKIYQNYIHGHNKPNTYFDVHTETWVCEDDIKEPDPGIRWDDFKIYNKITPKLGDNIPLDRFGPGKIELK